LLKENSYPFKVMSYEDLEEARAKRGAKETETSKGRRGQKRKSPSEEGAPVTKVKKARKTKLEAAEDEIVAAGMEDHCSILQL
jgi:hypothetical protein